MSTWTSRIKNSIWPSHMPIPSPGSGASSWEADVCNIFPRIKERMLETPQDPVHHAEGDVWTHTKMVIDCLLSESGYAALPQAIRGVMFYSALLHDVSKPETTKHNGDRVIAPGHSARGAVFSRRLLWEQGVDFYLREQVCRLIEVHQVPFFAFSNRKNLSSEFLVRQMSCDRSLDLLTLLATSDMKGRVCPDQNKVLDDIALFREQAKELSCLDQPYPFPDSATRIAYITSQGQRYPDQAVFQKDPFEVIMMSGLPASGKNTWIKLNSELPVVSYDDIRAKMGIRYGRGTGSIVHAADDQIREHLRKKKSFIINGTHLSRQMRRRQIELIRNYGGQVKVVYCEAEHGELIERNSSRDTSLSNSKLMGMTSRWEVPGLDEVESVHHQIKPLPLSKYTSPKISL